MSWFKKRREAKEVEEEARIKAAREKREREDKATFYWASMPSLTKPEIERILDLEDSIYHLPYSEVLGGFSQIHKLLLMGATLFKDTKKPRGARWRNEENRFGDIVWSVPDGVYFEVGIADNSGEEMPEDTPRITFGYNTESYWPSETFQVYLNEAGGDRELFTQLELSEMQELVSRLQVLIEFRETNPHLKENQ